MKKLITLLLVSTAIAGLFWYQQTKPQTDAQIRQKLGCDRVTTDAVGTDYYCDHLDAYRQDLKNGTLLDENWTKPMNSYANAAS